MIQVVERTFAVLEYIAQDPLASHRLSDIASSTSLNASTCVRILKTLGKLGYVVKNTQAAGYSLGPKAYSIIDRSSYRNNLVLASTAAIKRLAEKINESVLLATLYHGSRVVLYEIETNRQIQAQNEVEEEDCDNPLRTATGRLMLSYLSDQEREHVIGDKKNYAAVWPKITTKEQLIETLDDIRKQGWTIRKNESEVVGLAVPITENGIASASLGVYLPAFRFTQEHEKRILREMKLTVEKIEQELAEANKK